MGTWASSNFGNDGACDYHAKVVDFLMETFRPPSDLLEIDEVMAAGEMLLAICERCGVPGNLLDFDAASLQSSVLHIYDAEIDDYYPDPVHKRDRRAVIVRTFEELKACLHAKETT